MKVTKRTEYLVDGVPHIGLAELAERCQVTRMTIYQWRRDGHIPSGVRWRNYLLFDLVDAGAAVQYADRPRTRGRPRCGED